MARQVFHDSAHRLTVIICPRANIDFPPRLVLSPAVPPKSFDDFVLHQFSELFHVYLVSEDIVHFSGEIGFDEVIFLKVLLGVENEAEKHFFVSLIDVYGHEDH